MEELKEKDLIDMVLEAARRVNDDVRILTSDGGILGGGFSPSGGFDTTIILTTNEEAVDEKMLDAMIARFAPDLMRGKVTLYSESTTNPKYGEIVYSGGNLVYADSVESCGVLFFMGSKDEETYLREYFG